MAKEIRHTMTAAEAARRLGIPAGSIRAWASSKKLWSYEKDEHGRPLYDRDDLIALRDGTKRRTARGTRLRAARPPEPPPVLKEIVDKIRNACNVEVDDGQSCQ